MLSAARGCLGFFFFFFFRWLFPSIFIVFIHILAFFFLNVYSGAFQILYTFKTLE